MTPTDLLGNQPGLRRSQPPPGQGDRSRPSRRTPCRPRPHARRWWSQIIDVAMVARGAGGSRPHAPAQDLRIEGLPHLRPNQAGLGVHTGAARGRSHRSRGGTQGTGPGHEPLVEGRPAGVFVDFTRTRKTARLRRPTRCRPLRTRGFRRRSPGTRCPMRSGAVHHRSVPARFAEHGDPWAAMDDASGSLDALLRLAEELGPPENR